MNKKAAIVIPLVALCSVLSVQQRSPSKQRQAELELSGIKLHLGMSKAEVAEKLSSFEISKRNTDLWIVVAMKELSPSLQFTNGRLNYADRHWNTDDNDIFAALFGVAGALNEEGFFVCTVTTGTRASPELTSQNVWMACGEKSIFVLADLLVVENITITSTSSWASCTIHRKYPLC